MSNFFSSPGWKPYYGDLKGETNNNKKLSSFGQKEEECSAII